ncbi:MAG: S41 family peptidase [Chitinophagales bacterium]|nr:S41 family peptidase [Chitinophagales bacterium]
MQIPIHKTAIFLLLILTFWSNIYGQDRVTGWIEDINTLKTELPEQHINLFHKISQEEYNDQLDQIKANLPNVQDWQVVLSIAEVLAKLGDTHTTIWHRATMRQPLMYPLQLQAFKDGIYVVGATTSNRLDTLIKHQLIGINGIKTDSLLKLAGRVLVPENISIIKHHFVPALSSHYVLYHCGVVDSDEKVEFEFLSPEGTTIKLLLEAIPMRSYKATLLTLEPDSISFTERDNRSFFWHQHLEDDNILYIRYNSCNSREVLKKYHNKKVKNAPSFQKFEQKVLSVLEREKIEKLVFDVSINGGGSSLQGTNFARKIAAVYRGNTYVVTGRKTFSSAVINTLDFQRLLDAQIVGEVTSGKPNHYGEVRRMELPNSGAVVYYSTKYFERVDGDPAGIEPDIYIEQTFKEYINGVNPVWEYIKTL